MHTLHKILFAALLTPAVLFCATVTIQQGTTYQTMEAWGAPSDYLHWFPDKLKPYVIEDLVNLMGCTRIRCEAGGGNGEKSAWEPVNDDNDPEHINWAGINLARIDTDAVHLFVPFKQRVEANGERFDLYVSPSFFDGGSSGAIPRWLLYSPGEYSEFLLSQLLHLKNTYGIESRYITVLNEAGNGNPVTATVIRNVIKVLGPRLAAAGLSTKLQTPECVNGATSWNYINGSGGLASDPAIWPYVGLLSYHLYGSNDPARASIRDFAKGLGLSTGQTEYMGVTMSTLYADLTLGGNSVWEIYELPNIMPGNMTSSRAWFSRNDNYWQLRQVLAHVRAGAQRIEAVTSNPAVRTLAFRKNGAVTLVIHNTGSAAETVDISSLPAGDYAVSRAPVSGSYAELGVQTVGSGALSVQVPANAVVCVYPHLSANLPPVVTNYSSNPVYLKTPASQITLSSGAQDPELAALTTRWTVTGKPAGAAVVIAAPDAATTTVTGLSTAGDYIFAVDVSDGTNTVRKSVLLSVYTGNQPPAVFGFHNRAPVILVLPQDTTQLRGGGVDLEGDALTYLWSVAGAPAGTSVTLGAPSASSCPARGMSVAGTYRFRLAVNDGVNTVADTLNVTVQPANPAAPVISGITPAPTGPISADSVNLTAVTSDPDGDGLSHWWTVKSAPAGASPVFSRPGGPATVARGLSVGGTYVFTLIAVDRTRQATRDVTIVRTATAVEGRSGTPGETILGVALAGSAGNRILLVDLPRSGGFQIDLYDIHGRRLFHHAQNSAAAGTHALSLNTGATSFNPASGCYFAALRHAGNRVTRTLTLIE